LFFFMVMGFFYLNHIANNSFKSHSKTRM
jgi:hypothetical protein